ncbi:hypothetical protein ACSBL2_17200 [Pedobacter sp. AW31-3R]|uniref:hypothetical protein n=1 Tax=Pedobacter sp. AW31-3R TaxID=3445781 RepID=UPI003FA11107
MKKKKNFKSVSIFTLLILCGSFLAPNAMADGESGPGNDYLTKVDYERESNQKIPVADGNPLCTYIIWLEKGTDCYGSGSVKCSFYYSKMVKSTSIQPCNPAGPPP